MSILYAAHPGENQKWKPRPNLKLPTQLVLELVIINHPLRSHEAEGTDSAGAPRHRHWWIAANTGEVSKAKKVQKKEAINETERERVRQIIRLSLKGLWAKSHLTLALYLTIFFNLFYSLIKNSNFIAHFNSYLNSYPNPNPNPNPKFSPVQISNPNDAFVL